MENVAKVCEFQSIPEHWGNVYDEKKTEKVTLRSTILYKVIQRVGTGNISKKFYKAFIALISKPKKYIAGQTKYW